MSVINSIPLIAAGDDGYQISRSVRLRSSASAYFNRTPASAGSQTTWTMSMWVKRGALGVRQFITMSGVNPNPSQVWQVEFDANNKLDFYNQTIGTYRRTTQVFRDSSAWYHIVFGADTNNATAQNRFRCWVNGVEVTAWDVNSTISSGYTFAYNGAYLHGIGAYTYSGNGLPLDGYLTEVNFIDGQALTPSSFGETDAVTGVWKPKKYAGTYGTNGFYLNFSDPSAATAAAIGKDSSGNGNNWTPNNISVTAGVTYDSMLDTPTPYDDGGNGRGNYCVINPIALGTSGAPTITGGNLNVSTPTTGFGVCLGTIGVSSGKWYWEFTATSSSTNNYFVGISNGSASLTNYIGSDANGWGYFGNNGSKYNNGSASAYGASYTAGDVIGVAIDLDGGTITFYKNNTSQGQAFSGLTGTIFPAYSDGSGTVGSVGSFNFGQRPFAYTPPTGFKALNTQNLPEPTIVDGGEYFNPVLYTGNATARSITGVGFQPDFVWTKSRSGAESHRLYDSVRGATKSLYSNLTNAEATEAQSLTAFDSDGFSLGTGAPNTNAVTYVAWNWKANGAGVSNTDGSITSTVSAGVTQGFSVVTWTTPSTGIAYTIGHGLGVVPSLIIMKERTTGSTSWVTHHKAVMSNSSQYLLLNTTGAIASASNIFGSLMPSSTVFGNTSGTGINVSAQAVAYCFAEVPGFSKFGSYTGNGSADGPFVFCGFRPAFVMMKRTDAVSSWYINDTGRSPDNDTTGEDLYPNLSDAQGGTVPIDILSNGFKMRTANNSRNQSGGTYIYAAFAEHPFSKALAR